MGKEAGITTGQWNSINGVASYRVTGIADTMRALRLFEPELYLKLRKDLVEDAKPLAQDIGKQFPIATNLTKWHATGRKGASRLPGYNGARAQSKVKPIAGTGRAHGKGKAILRLQQMDGGAQVFDTAGSQSRGSQFVKNLDKHSRVKSRGGGFRSRVMYPQTKKRQYMVQEIVAVVVRQLERQTTKRLTGGLGAIGRTKF